MTKKGTVLSTSKRTVPLKLRKKKEKKKEEKKETL
jgi:hypothetical protein